MSDELKPCPLCDGPAKVTPYKPNYLWHIGCPACKLSISYVGPIEHEMTVALWNTRKHIPPVPELAGTHPVVLYLATKEEADELMAEVKSAKPNMEVRHL